MTSRHIALEDFELYRTAESFLREDHEEFMAGPEYYGTATIESVSKAVDELIEPSIKHYNEWIEREVLGAWMAGYDYLHHAKRPAFHSAGAKERCYPSNSEKPKRVHRRHDSSWTVRSYDLRWLFPDDVEAWRDGGHDSAM